ncbi:MAG: metal-dependent hydrolase [Clostridium sp.]|uniref:metal-dependent hydrolase n=1 Tax=Clostridium sp. TaxID=1506 RepID=UPI003D6CB9F2
MNGRSHQKIAMLSYAIVATIPAINSMIIFNNRYIRIPMGITLMGLGAAAVSGLIVDADSQNSMISQINPLTSASTKVINNIGDLLRLLLRLLLGLGSCALILWYITPITNWLTSIKYIGEFSHIYSYENIHLYAKVFTYFLSLIFLILGLTNERIYKKIPIIGSVYRKLSKSISKSSHNFKRITLMLTYVIVSIILAIYNYTNINDIYVYLICILLICIAAFPHRSFLHSIEGVIVFTISASYVFDKLGQKYLTGCFFIGYISHIYWADIFTKEGVPFLSLPRFIAQALKKLGFRNIFVITLEKIGKLKLRLPPHISTGSEYGNLFEVIYILFLFTVAIIGFLVYGVDFRLI